VQGMYVEILGETKLDHEEAEDAVSFMLNILLSKEQTENLFITLEFCKLPNCVGELFDSEDGSYHIKIRNSMSRHRQLITIAHELVHLKQLVTKEWINVISDKNTCKFKDENVCIISNHYFDLPWEIEAHGREIGLVHRFVEHLSAKSLIDNNESVG
jgi:hypothetical protein